MPGALFRCERLYFEVSHCLRISGTRLCGTAAAEQRDLYETLGVEPSATAREIKAAYYKLSKLYHPDRHDVEEDKRFAAEKFLQVAEAYEILSSDKKRKAYDVRCQERSVPTPSGSWPTQRAKTKQNFEDLGLDYKTFEEFQRSVNTRKQRTRHDHWQMPDEFFAHFGSRQFTNVFRPQSTYFTYSYKDAMQRQREMKEWEILKEIEEEKLRNKYKTPTFEVMEMEKKRRKLAEKRALNFLMLIFGFLMITSCIRRM